MKSKQELSIPKALPKPTRKTHAFYMQHAYNQSINAWDADEVPVGASYCFEGEIIASAYNQTREQKDPSAHAEMIAITQAANS